MVIYTITSQIAQFWIGHWYTLSFATEPAWYNRIRPREVWNPDHEDFPAQLVTEKYFTNTVTYFLKDVLSAKSMPNKYICLLVVVKSKA